MQSFQTRTTKWALADALPLVLLGALAQGVCAGLVEYQAAVTSEPTLISYYTFDAGNANDTVGTNHGTASGIGSVSFVPALLHGGLAVALSGGGHIQIPAVADFDFTDGSGTVEAWYRALWTSNPGYNPAILSGRAGNPVRYSIHEEGANRAKLMGWTGTYREYGHHPLNQDWHHVAVVFDSGNATFYFDGRNLGTQGLPLGTTGLPYQLGASHTNGQEAWIGELDEVAFYSAPLSSATVAAHFAAMRSDQMIAHWSFDNGTARDPVGGHHGTLVGDAAIVPGGEGGRALSLDGDGDYVDAGRWSLGGNFTVAAWVRPDNVSADWRGFLSKNSMAGQNVFWFGQHSNDGWLRFGNYLDGSNTETFLDSGTVAVGNAKWQHVVASYDGHYQKIYVNGNLVAVSPDRNTVQATGDAPLYIGRIQVVSNCFDGLMDEVRVYNYAVDQPAVLGMMAPVVAQFGALELNKPAAGTSSWGYTAIDGTGKVRLDVPGNQDIWLTRGNAPLLLTPPPTGDFGDSRPTCRPTACFIRSPA